MNTTLLKILGIILYNKDTAEYASYSAEFSRERNLQTSDQLDQRQRLEEEITLEFMQAYKGPRMNGASLLYGGH